MFFRRVACSIRLRLRNYHLLSGNHQSKIRIKHIFHLLTLRIRASSLPFLILLQKKSDLTYFLLRFTVLRCSFEFKHCSKYKFFATHYQISCCFVLLSLIHLDSMWHLQIPAILLHLRMISCPAIFSSRLAYAICFIQGIFWISFNACWFCEYLEGCFVCLTLE